MKKWVGVVLAIALVVAGTGAAVWVSHSRADHPAVAATIGHPPAPIAPPGDRIRRENARKGTRAWLLHTRRGASPIEGYASATSVAAGETFEVYVRTLAPHYTATVFRMGWYHGDSARRYASLGTFPGDPQSPCPDTGLRHTVTCDWSPSFPVATARRWTTGYYLIKLSASNGAQSYVPFIVREAVPRAPILVQASVTTWEAYNPWGGRSLYGGPCYRTFNPHPPPSRGPAASPSATPSSAPRPSATPSAAPSPSSTPSPVGSLALVRAPARAPRPAPESRAAPVPAGSGAVSSPPQQQQQQQTVQEGEGCFETRSRAVTFDRPYAYPGVGQFFRFELPLVRFLEQKGYDVAYATDIDLQQGNEALDVRKVFISAGHDEYYSSTMRNRVRAALDAGTSLAFFGGNDMYRHVRFETSPLGRDRIEVNYKFAGEDPETRLDPAQSTGDWRDYPTHEPEQALMGAQYSCNPVNVPWVATGQPSWLFRGTGMVAGDTVPGLVGYEYDRHFGGIGPAGVALVSRSPVRCRGVLDEQNTTFYVARSGAAVFDAGTIWWDCALAGACKGHPPDERIRTLAVDLLNAMLRKRFQ